MPGPEQLIKTAIVLPLRVTRGVIEFGLGLLPGGSPDDDTRFDVAPGAAHATHAAAEEAVEREREPTEELPPSEDDLSGHVEAETELVAKAADAEASEAPPGPELHVDEPWEGYRRMKVDEIVSRLEGQSPEVLAAVELYETTHRHRGGILNVVRSAARD